MSTSFTHKEQLTLNIFAHIISSGNGFPRWRSAIHTPHQPHHLPHRPFPHPSTHLPQPPASGTDAYCQGKNNDLKSEDLDSNSYNLAGLLRQVSSSLSLSVCMCMVKRVDEMISKVSSQISDLLKVPAAAAAAKSLQLCPTLCDPIDSSLPGSPIPGILQARTLEWVAISFSNAWKWKWSQSVVGYC